MIKFFIDNVEVEAQKGETILQVARRNGFYIPTMCYLTKTAPISSCRICVIEIEEVDGFVLSCQTPPVEGIKVITNSEELFRHRQNIMKLYDVNHPLQCGVCDKSGECDLQNKTLEFDIKSQDFSAIEQKRKNKKWGLLSYDPSLCIMCEKCVHTCNEIVGTEAHYTNKGGYKSETNIKMTRCVQCGDCISVCPVGALIATDFKYNSNAWELEKIPSTCSHCSSGCHLYYEVKKVGVGVKPTKEIFRVTNEFEFTSLCGAGRFNFNFENKVSQKCEDSFNKTIDAFKKADTINFSSYITNEEALILQRLKEKYGYKLVNDDAYNYQNFLNNYSKVSGKSLYGSSLKSLKNSDFIITIGTRITTDNPIVKYNINNALKRKKAEIIYIHPIEDSTLQPIITQFVKHEVGSEEAILTLIAKEFINKDDLNENLKTFFNNLDIGYLSSESSVSEEEIDRIKLKSKRKKNLTLVIGEDLFSHSESENIAKLVGLIDRYSDFEILIIPSKTNTLGVTLICDLDKDVGKYSIGYNAKGDFTLSSLGDGDLDIPALNQQEGTFTNIDKRVVVLNTALPYNGYILNDIANKLDINKKYTIDYTLELPTEKGYKSIEFDKLDNYFNNVGDDFRGYILNNIECKNEDIKLDDITDLDEFNGIIIYDVNPLSQFNQFTNKAKSSESYLFGSKQFATVNKLKNGNKIEIVLDKIKLERIFKIDTSLKGSIGLNPTFDLDLIGDKINSNYRYNRVKITKMVEK